MKELSNYEVMAILASKGVKASEGDSDFETIISWDNIDKINEALKDIHDKLLILPGAGYGGGTIIATKKKK